MTEKPSVQVHDQDSPLMLVLYFLAYLSVLVRMLLHDRDTGVVQAPAYGLMAGFLVLSLARPRLSQRWAPAIHITLALRSLIIFALLLTRPRVDFYAMLFVALSVVAASELPNPVDLVWIGVFCAGTALGLIASFWIKGAGFIPTYLAGILILGLYGRASRNAQTARARSEQLRAELEAANLRLQAYAESAEERYREVFENTSDGIFIIDVTPEGRFTIDSFNPAQERIVGLSNAEVSGKCIDEILPKETTDPIIANYHACIKAGKSFSFEETLSFPAGLGYFYTTLIPLRDATGRTYRIICVAHDITQRKKAEDALRESEERFRILSEQSQVGIGIIQEGRFRYLNPAFTAATGHETSDTLDAIMNGSHDPENELQKSVQKLCSSQEKITQPIHLPAISLQTLQGKSRWFNAYLKNVHLGGRPAVMIALVDITEEKKAQDEAMARQKQLIRADKLASLGVLVAGVAHEISNPNQAIMLNAHVMKDAWEGASPVLQQYYRENGDFPMNGIMYSQNREAIPGCLSAILDCAGKIETIVSDLKGYARQERTEEFRAMDINIVAKASLTLVSNLLKKSTQNLSVNLASNLPQIEGNFQRLEQVFINLLQNACQALPDATRGIFVSTSCNENGDEVRFEVCDEGSGIAPEDLPRIIDPFFTTKRESGGTGLGLAISAVIMGEHGGRMEHTSTLGEGTRAVVILPAVGRRKVRPT